MGLFGGSDNSKKLADITIKNPREVFKDILKITSGTNVDRSTPYNLFYEIIAFRGVVEGLGTSTIVANTALAIADAGLTVCVIDTSILAPVQDILLHTNVESIPSDNRIDWFDMPYEKKSPLHVSRINGNVSVLSFAGKKRGIVDFLSSNDATELIDIALTELRNKFDIILIDSCQEVSSVNIGALQQAQNIIQVWSDTPQVTRNIDNYITNSITLSIPLDKMRYVVMNKVTKDLIGSNSDEILNQYRLKKLAEMPNSSGIQRTTAMGKSLWQMESTDEDIIEFTTVIATIVCHILGLDNKSQAKGSFTANDVDEGKVRGTLRNKNKKKAKDSDTPIAPPDYIMSVTEGDKKVWSGSSRVPVENLNDDDLIRMEDMDDDIREDKEALSKSLLRNARG